MKSRYLHMKLFRIIVLVSVCIFFGQDVIGQIPPGYYDNAAGLNGTQLQDTLHAITDDHTVATYSDLWDLFEQTDKKPNGKVWDIYSDIPGGTPPYQFNFFLDQCGNYTMEGDCYNREHSFPKSWIGGSIYPMYSDLFHIYPTDGYVNNKRANYVYGEVGNISWTSLNGSKLGDCISPGFSGMAFEPVDDYKGDLARSYFYMATRYYGEDSGWPGSDMFDGSQPKSWALELLRNWHEYDPVSQKETDRNNAVYGIQGNRNPFIDHPEFVDMIWFYTAIDESSSTLAMSMSVYPNPVKNILTVRFHERIDFKNIGVTFTNITGCPIELRIRENADQLLINTGILSTGMYILTVSDQSSGETSSFKIIK